MTKKRLKISAKKTSAPSDERPTAACDKGACSCGCGCQGAKGVILAGTALAVVLSLIACVQSCSLDKRIASWVENNPEAIELAISPEARLSKQIIADETNYSLGNPDGKFVIIEFFDYNCGWCQRTNEAMHNALEKSEAKNIRWIPIDTPIFGASSEIIARYVLAAGKQGKYKQMHDAVATGNSRLSEARSNISKAVSEYATKNKLDRNSQDASVQEKLREYSSEITAPEYVKAMEEIGKKLGLDVEKLTKDAQSQAISEKLEANQALAAKLEVNGVPMLIVNGKKHGGALFGDALDAVVAESAK